ncbi:hypothetical protein Tco_1202826 [Tanacetum coccineum]
MDVSWSRLDFYIIFYLRDLSFARLAKVMAAPVISILSDSSEESVGSHAPRVILFGAIPAIIPVIPKVPIIPTNPLVAPEDSLPHVPELPLVSPFLCSDDSKADDESEPGKQRPERHESLAVHDAVVLRWRDRVASRPSSPSGSSSHDTLAPSSECFPPLLLLLKLTRDIVDARTSYRIPDILKAHLLSDSSLYSSSDTSLLVHFQIHYQIHHKFILQDVIHLVWVVEVIASDIREDKEEIKAEASAGGMVEIEVDPRVRPIVVEDVLEHVTANGAVEITYEPLGDLIQRFHDHAEEIPVGRIANIETAHRQTLTITHSGMTPKAIEELVNRHVEEALSAYEETRAA